MLTVFLFTYELNTKHDESLQDKIENKLSELSADTDGWKNLNKTAYVFTKNINDYKIDSALNALFNEKDNLYLLALTFPADGASGSKAVSTVEWIANQLRKTPDLNEKQ